MYLVDVREIKEIRNGKNSRDFDRWPEVASKFYDEQSFVVIYGQEFVLKTLSICGMIQFIRKVAFPFKFILFFKILIQLYPKMSVIDG